MEGSPDWRALQRFQIKIHVLYSIVYVTASFVYDSLEDFAEISGSFDKMSFALPSAENRELDDGELKDQATLLLEGALDEKNTEFAKIGAITVTIE